MTASGTERSFMRRTVAPATPWRVRPIGIHVEHPQMGNGTEIALRARTLAGEEVAVMRAVAPYMLGVPVFLTVIIWLREVV